MARSQKTRIVVYCVFFVALLALAVFYRPTDALSRPTERTRPVLQSK